MDGNTADDKLAKLGEKWANAAVESFRKSEDLKFLSQLKLNEALSFDMDSNSRLVLIDESNKLLEHSDLCKRTAEWEQRMAEKVQIRLNRPRK